METLEEEKATMPILDLHPRMYGFYDELVVSVSPGLNKDSSDGQMKSFYTITDCVSESDRYN